MTKMLPIFEQLETIWAFYVCLPLSLLDISSNCVYLMAASALNRLISATLVKTDRHPIRMDPEELQERFNDTV